MIQKATAATRPLAAALLGTACFVAAPGASPALRADDGRMQTEMKLCRVYPKRKADLEQWLRRELVPGGATREDVFAIFGRNYYHPFLSFDDDRRDENVFVYPLDGLGVPEHDKYDAVFIHFDERSGLLLRAALGEMDHQTGFHIGETSNPSEDDDSEGRQPE
jgi:hypothetical protein